MKTNPGVNPTTSKATSQKNRVDNKDDLDSRKNEENIFKGDDVTHNEKETKEDNLKKK